MVLATAYVYGTGTGPQVTFSPATQSTLGGDLNVPRGVAVDGSGNVFVADTNNNTVKEILAGGTVTILGGNSAAALGYQEMTSAWSRYSYDTLSEGTRRVGSTVERATSITQTRRFWGCGSIGIIGGKLVPQRLQCSEERFGFFQLSPPF
jgi:DNA-binding beta-propeller fold protein YncE